MRVHRSAHARHFTVLPNGLLQDRRLSYTARGLLADLLSRPDGRREDGRQMADTSPQGRGTIRRALKELTEAGYYRVDTLRLPNGTVRSQAHVYDTPQLAVPGVPHLGPGEATTGPADSPSVKNRSKATSLPAEQADAQSAGADRADDPDGREEDHEVDQDHLAVPDAQVHAAMATLIQVIRPEPRLRLAETEKASAIRSRRMTFRCSRMVCGVGRQGFGVGLSRLERSV